MTNNNNIQAMIDKFNDAMQVSIEIYAKKAQLLNERAAAKKEQDEKDNFPTFKITRARRFLNGGHLKDFTACMLNISKKEVDRDKYNQARVKYEKLAAIKKQRDKNNEKITELNHSINNIDMMAVINEQHIKNIMAGVLAAAINDVSARVKYKVSHTCFYNRLHDLVKDIFILGSATNKYNEPYYSLTYIDSRRNIRLSVQIDLDNLDEKGRLIKPLTIKDIEPLNDTHLYFRVLHILKEREKMKELERQLDNSRMAISKLSLGLYNE